MSREYPDWISPERAAEGNRVFSGTVPLSRMQRLAPLLVNVDGVASFSAGFDHDINHRVIIDLQVEASLALICQASLDVYAELVRRRCQLCAITHESERLDLPENYEVVKTEHGRLAIATLVEDELLLGFPTFPRKPGLKIVEYSSGAETPGSGDPRTGDKENPFSTLRDLLKQNEHK